MDARLAMILSIGGVLAAGSAAAMVNAEVLRQDGGGSVTTPATAAFLAVTDVTAATTAIATTPSIPTTLVEVIPTPPTAVLATPPATAHPTFPTLPATIPAATIPSPTAVAPATQQTFRLGDAATAVLDTANGRLSIVTVAPHPGWALERAEQDDSTSVEIRLRSAIGEVRFEASLVRGVVVVSLEGPGTGSTVPGGSTLSTSVTVDDHGGEDNSGPGSGDSSGDDNSGPGGGAEDNSGPGGGGSG